MKMKRMDVVIDYRKYLKNYLTKYDILNRYTIHIYLFK